ncbi:hydroxyquinol 1,2-dioxygenase [Pseudonocardia sediminis]|uniref:Hydroxyquinol 1,2-dioxygenase n=2 Tax=Pseudonocardia sediminis TaxID=1397368 RepID=A0A4Q7UX26_PSEST|nr:hydroxyquinol 1,2-dioxygenase [Pseudonocardia sediminis]
MTVHPMTSEALSDEVVASVGNAPARTREVLQALLRHLHAFAAEVNLTTAEWEAGIDFLTRAGHITDDERQEFILLSDVLGLSMQVVGLNAAEDPRATESTVFGPFFVEKTPHVGLGDDIAAGAPGEPCWIDGTVTDVHGAPIAGARVDIWETDGDGVYDVQYGDSRTAARGYLVTGDDGRYAFWSLRPVAYSIPADGPVGDLLSATGRRTMRPAHVHLRVTADGYRQLVTHVFDRTDPYIAEDAVFGVKESLIVDFEPQSPGTGPGGRELDSTWYRVSYDLVLADA